MTVCLSVCLSVCLWDTICKPFTKILRLSFNMQNGQATVFLPGRQTQQKPLVCVSWHSWNMEDTNEYLRTRVAKDTQPSCSSITCSFGTNTLATQGLFVQSSRLKMKHCTIWTSLQTMFSIKTGKMRRNVSKQGVVYEAWHSLLWSPVNCNQFCPDDSFKRCILMYLNHADIFVFWRQKCFSCLFDLFFESDRFMCPAHKLRYGWRWGWGSGTKNAGLW